MDNRKLTPIALAIDLANENPQGQRPNWWWKQKLEELKQKEIDVFRDMFEEGLTSNYFSDFDKYFDKNLTQE